MDIKKWFAGDREFHEGLELLRKHCGNKTLVLNVSRKFFKRGETPELRRKLEYNLGKIAKINPPLLQDVGKPKIDNQEIVFKKASSKTTVPAPKLTEEEFSNRVKILDNAVNLKELPESLQRKYLNVKKDFPHMATLHAQLREEKNDLRRSEIRRELVALENLQLAFWNELDEHWAIEKARAQKAEEERLMLPENRIPVVKELISKAEKTIAIKERELKDYTPAQRKYKNRVNAIAALKKQIDELERELADLNAAL